MLTEGVHKLCSMKLGPVLVNSGVCLTIKATSVYKVADLCSAMQVVWFA